MHDGGSGLAAVYCCSLSLAMATPMSRSWNLVPANPSALSTWSFLTVTNANPLDRPLNFPNLDRTSSTSLGAAPKRSANSLDTSSVVLSKERLFT